MTSFLFAAYAEASIPFCVGLGKFLVVPTMIFLFLSFRNLGSWEPPWLSKTGTLLLTALAAILMGFVLFGVLYTSSVLVKWAMVSDYRFSIAGGIILVILLSLVPPMRNPIWKSMSRAGSSIRESIAGMIAKVERGLLMHESR